MLTSYTQADIAEAAHTRIGVERPTTPLEPNFGPGVVRQLKSATRNNLMVGGADLAGQAIKAGLVDALQQFLVPVVGGGKRSPRVSVGI